MAPHPMQAAVFFPMGSLRICAAGINFVKGFKYVAWA